MTVTDTDAPSEVTSDTAPALTPPEPATGFAALLGTGDHTTIGRLYIGTSFVFLLVAAATGMLLSIEKIDVSGIDVLDADVIVQLLSVFRVSSVFLFLVPLLLGLALCVVPRQVGAPTVAFPRAAAASYWTYLIGGGIVLASVIADGGPGGGDPDAVALFVAAMIMVLVALSLAAVCVATTGLALRTEGMSVRRTPLFTWANVVVAGLWILTLPVLAGVLLLAYVDLRYGPTLIGGGDQLLLRMAWVWSQPSNYVFVIPVLGIIADISPVAARTRFTQHRLAMGCIGAFAVFSFGAWAMPSWAPTTDGDPLLAYTNEVPFVAASFLVVVPILALAGLVADTVRKGTARVVSPLVWALAALVMLLAGAANGALVSIDPLDLVNTTAATAQIHYVLGAGMLGALGGLVYWSPVIFRRAFPELASTGLAGLGLVGTVLLCLPDLISGFVGQRSQLGGAPGDASSGDVDAIEALNLVSTIGAAILALVAVGFLGLLVRTVGGKDEVVDPWEGNTLEWATGDELPEIMSEAPVYDARHAAEVAS